jgi:hypothetical protein
MGWSLRRWWMQLFRAPNRAAAPDAVGDEGGSAPPGGSGSAGADGADSPDRAHAGPARRRYAAPPPDDDPQREARLGAVLQALGAGSLDRVELGRQVGAADWGPGRLDAVVLRDGGDGTVRARYAD